MARPPAPRPRPIGVPASVARLGDVLAKLPGIGEKVGLRHALVLAMGDLGPKGLAAEVGQALVSVQNEIRSCPRCHGLAEVGGHAPGEVVLCAICKDTRREDGILCVVERVQDLMAIERSMKMRGRYFVLGKLVRPLEGVGADELPLEDLANGLTVGMEVILCLPHSVEGDATAMVIAQELDGVGVRVTRLRSGISHGSDLEFADQVTIGRALDGREEMKGR